MLNVDGVHMFIFILPFMAVINDHLLYMPRRIFPESYKFMYEM